MAISTHLVVNNGICYYWHLVSRMAISHFYWHLLVNNGNFILLLTSSQLIRNYREKYQCIENTCRYKVDGPPKPSQHWSTEWSLDCSLVSLRLKGRWTPQSTLPEHRRAISHFYWHFVVNNGNFILLLTSSQLIRKYKEIQVHREHM